MKIAYLISMVKGGVPAFTFREIDLLSRSGFEIALYPLTYRPGPYMPRPDWRVCRVSVIKVMLANLYSLVRFPVHYASMLLLAIRTRSLAEFALSAFFARDMAAWGAEHVHCHFGDSKLYTGYYCSKWLGVPLTATLHAYEIHRNPNPVMFKMASESCTKLIVQSEFNRNAVREKLGVDPSKMEIIRAHGDMTGDNTDASLKLLIVGEFREKKGHEVLFSAVKKLGRKDIVVWVVGEGALDVPDMARRIGVADRTVFLGSLGKDLLDIVYEACDIFVLPSRATADGDHEGIPAVLMEAMSHSKPVISTRHAGIPELVEEILVDENDVGALAQAIAALADDPERRAAMGEKNRLIIKQRFSDDAALRLGEVFRESRSNREGSTSR